MDVMGIRRKIIMAQDNFIPPAYQKHDYIECSGYNARIDTGVAGNDNTLKFDFTYMPLAQSNYFGSFGNYNGESNRCWRLIQATSSNSRQYYVNSNVRKAGVSKGVTAVSSATGTIIMHKTHFTIEYGKITVESDDGYTGTETQAEDTTEPISQTNVAIGAPSCTNTGLTVKGRFYGSFKIYKGNKLIRNYFPVVRKSDSKAGLYDTVNHTFNHSIGSAEFVAGNE